MNVILARFAIAISAFELPLNIFRFVSGAVVRSVDVIGRRVQCEWPCQFLWNAIKNISALQFNCAHIYMAV